MKSLIALSMVLASFTSFADDSSAAGAKCLKKAKRYYYQNGSKSDIPLNFNFDRVLPAGEPVKGFGEKVLAVFEEDKLIYSVSGSYHSGWFNDVSVVNPKTCETDDLINIYSE